MQTLIALISTLESVHFSLVKTFGNIKLSLMQNTDKIF